MSRLNRFAIAFATVAVVLSAPGAHAQKRVVNYANDDAAFLALRDASRSGDVAKAEELAARLSGYSIPSYVDYYRLKARFLATPEQEIRDYLNRYAGTAIADRLRNDWLLELGRARNWALFDEQYPQFELNDDIQVKCYALMSRALRGKSVAEEARGVLVSPVNYGEACPALITTLVGNGQFSAGDVWAQIRMAADSGATSTIRRLVPLTDASEPALMQAIEKPAAVVARGAGSGRASRETFLVALGRVAKANPSQAVSALLESDDKLSKPELAIAWSQIALQSSLKLAPDAPVYWHRTAGAPLSPEGHHWKVRAALRAGDWKLVKSAIEAMPTSVKNDPAWVYWLGRAYKAEGKQEEAMAQFLTIVSQNNFYGQLATEELGQKIVAPPRAQPVTPEEIAPMAENQGFRDAFKLIDLNMRFEGYREWNWQLRRMNERQLLAAAEYARQKNSLDRMVNTSDRTKVEVDFTQRFPSPFRDVMQSATQNLGLDMAWVYGLIRQESRFILNARSHVGASGLMQLMPATAKWVARKIGMNNFSQNEVNDINTNILLGTNYLNMVLGDLDGSQAMATAAYNAGPGRPRAWRSTLPNTVEGAIFAESIPFSETRDYVKKVLSNATYYAALFEGKPQSLKARLGMVGPKEFVPSELP